MIVVFVLTDAPQETTEVVGNSETDCDGSTIAGPRLGDFVEASLKFRGESKSIAMKLIAHLTKAINSSKRRFCRQVSLNFYFGMPWANINTFSSSFHNK